jgi:hypothetical protein
MIKASKMKNLILSYIFLFSMINVSLAQEGSNQNGFGSKKLIVMVNTAKWCPVCKANGPRVEKNVLSKFQENKHCEILINDLSNKETKKTSEQVYTAAGIHEVAKNNKGTGVIYFIDYKSKRLISMISIAKTDEEIINAFDKALSSL